MKPKNAKKQFLKRLETAELTLKDLDVTRGIEAMLSFYAEERADGCRLDEDGDMLLFQWGTNDWGDGPSFEVNITRQLIVSDDEDEEPRQLALTFQFEPSVGVAAGDDNRWCELPNGLPAFREFVEKSAALKASAKQQPKSVTLRFGRT